MRIGIDVSILSSRLTGIGYYTLSLVHALSRLQGEVEWVLLGADPTFGVLPEAANVKAVNAKKLAGWRRVIWQQFDLPRLALRYGIDILHCPDFSRPLWCPVPVVNTIHDLSYYSDAPYFPHSKKLYKRAMTRWTIKHSSMIVAVSEFTRQEFFERFPNHRRLVFVVHNGVKAVQAEPRPKAEPPFLLFVGNLEARKNLVTLIEAYNFLRTRGQVQHHLVLAGQNVWGAEKVMSAAQKSPFRQDIHLCGYVSEDELIRLYRSADAFVYPSLYEGFGLPILEAMAYGTPVICSRIASLCEVAGGAAEYFNPYSVDDVAGSIERVLSSSDLQTTLRNKGLRHIRKFSWDECARRHREIYNSLLTLR